MSGCVHMNSEEFCGSCAPGKLREARQEIERLTFIVNDRQERGNEMLARAERAEHEAVGLRQHLEFRRQEIVRLRNQPSVAICLEERAEGNGGCGACALCCKEQRERAEAVESEAAKMRVALLLDAAAFVRIRARWPHIEVPNANASGRLGVPRTADPGSPTCLRCSIEEEILGPACDGFVGEE